MLLPVDAPASPSATRLGTPGWLDGRLVLGVLLVLVSVVVGARVLSSADRSESVWVLTRDLAAGTPVEQDDVRRGKARLFGDSARYLSADSPLPAGYVLVRAVGVGELLPRAALVDPAAAPDVRAVTVPVAAGHVPPDLAAKQLVDVYVTPTPPSGSKVPVAPPRLVVARVVVLQPPAEDRLGGGGADRGVVLQVSPGQVTVVLAAMAEGRIDLVRVPQGRVPAP